MLEERNEIIVANLFQNNKPTNVNKGRFKKFMLGKLEDFSLKWVDGVPSVHHFSPLVVH